MKGVFLWSLPFVAWLVFVVAVGVGWASSPVPAVYRCTRPQGCVAQIPDGEGGLKWVGFRRGDEVDTSQGWIVKPGKGWKKL